MLLYIWFLLTLPQDRQICTLWISQPPTPEALIQACGTDLLAPFRLDVYYQGQIVCSKPGSSLLWIKQDCTLSGPLSSYQIRVMQPGYQTAICSVTMPTSTQPSAEEIRRQCPEVKGPITNYQLRYAGSRQADQPLTMCKPPAVEQPVTIATSETYHLLAGKLIWHGLVKANCPAGSLNPATFAASPCGIEAARPQMYSWQNGMDTEILSAARAWNVPAQLLKEIISRETQFWPWTGTDGEHGLIQITENGAELVLQQYQPGYYQLSPRARQEARIAWLKQIDCEACTPVQAYDHAKRVMNLYAQSLAAYYCTYGDWEKAMSAWNVNHQLDVEG